jgi:multicomponent Na+:H+ antiporter subunit B
LKSVALAVVLVLGSLLLYVTLEFPEFGDPGAPANLHVSPYYIENTIADTGVPNIVTAILADYRGFDTMFETSVIFAAGLACFFLLRVVRRRAPEARLYRHIPTDITIRIEKGGRLPRTCSEFERIDSVWVPYDLIIHITSRLIIPFIQLFALYVIAHGHHSPGGGFQGGVILGAAIILFALCHNLRTTIRRFSEKTIALLCSLGVIIYTGTGVMCILLGSNFLDYSALASLLGVDRVMARSHGILMVEIGVAIAVTAVMVWIYYNLSSAGRQDEGL